jgi:LmbE family N-acetylglucosaminyl deacetylase
MSQTCLIICAHSDDQVLGAGGTIQELVRDGYQVKTLIFSYGEKSHPHLSEEHVRKVRKDESYEADTILGSHGVEFIDVPEGQFAESMRARKVVKRRLEEFVPDIVFTHSEDDPHPDHRAVHRVVLDTYDELKTVESDIYAFDVWNVWNLKKRHLPRLYVGIDKYKRVKLQALHVFKSQISMFSHTYLNNVLYVKQLVQSLVNGLHTDNTFAEVFYKYR